MCIFAHETCRQKYMWIADNKLLIIIIIDYK